MLSLRCVSVCVDAWGYNPIVPSSVFPSVVCEQWSVCDWTHTERPSRWLIMDELNPYVWMFHHVEEKEETERLYVTFSLWFIDLYISLTSSNLLYHPHFLRSFLYYYFSSLLDLLFNLCLFLSLATTTSFAYFFLVSSSPPRQGTVSARSRDINMHREALGWHRHRVCLCHLNPIRVTLSTAETRRDEGVTAERERRKAQENVSGRREQLQ